MISLASDYLLFQLSSGESIPFSAEMISVEVMGDAASVFEPEFVKHAAASVYHYFKNELGRENLRRRICPRAGKSVAWFRFQS
jgi:hypothetical protein